MKRIILIVLLCLVSVFGWGTTYYISPTGNDTTGDGSSGTPWATLDKAFSQMSASDTVKLKDGTYTGALNVINNDVPNGSVGNLTIIEAENAHSATLDGENTRWMLNIEVSDFSYKEYIKIDGLRLVNGEDGVARITGDVRYIEIYRTGFHGQSNDNKYAQIVGINAYSDAGKTHQPSYILLEECWTWGAGRYGVQLWYTHHNTIRRSVFRVDAGFYDTQPVSGISIYASDNNLIENSIAIDGEPTDGGADKSGFYLTASTGGGVGEAIASDNRWYGNLAINNLGTGFRNDPNDTDDPKDNHTNNTWLNNIAAGNTSYGFSWAGGTTHDTTATYNTAWDNGTGGFYSNNQTGTHLYNHWISQSNTGIAYGGSYGTRQYNLYYGNGSVGTPGSNSLNEDSNLLYLPQKEASTPEAGDSSQVGAEILKRYEDGVLGAIDLWPFPNEAWIRSDMRGVSERGFAADGQNLTDYIWNYLGNGGYPDDNLQRSRYKKGLPSLLATAQVWGLYLLNIYLLIALLRTYRKMKYWKGRALFYDDNDNLNAMSEINKYLEGENNG